MFGKGIPMVTTALALSSVKSRPSLTLPLQTAMRSAPSTIKKKKTTFSITGKQGMMGNITVELGKPARHDLLKMMTMSACVLLFTQV